MGTAVVTATYRHRNEPTLNFDEEVEEEEEVAAATRPLECLGDCEEPLLRRDEDRDLVVDMTLCGLHRSVSIQLTFLTHHHHFMSTYLLVIIVSLSRVDLLRTFEPAGFFYYIPVGFF